MFEQGTVETIDCVPWEDLDPGMVLAVGVRAKNGEVTLSEGAHLTGDDIEALKSARRSGYFIRCDETHYTPKDSVNLEEELSWFSDSFSGIREFLIDADTRGLIESVTEWLDHNRILGEQDVTEEFVDYFSTLKGFEARHQSLRETLANRPPGKRTEIRRDVLEEIIRGGKPNWAGLRSEPDGIDQDLLELHRLRTDLYDRTVELFLEHEDVFRSLSEAIPSPEYLESPSESGREFLLGLRSMDPEELNVTDPVSDLNDDWLGVLEPPAFDEGDWEFSYITARVKQIIENLLVRGVFMSSVAFDLIELIEREVSRGDNLYRRLTFPLKDQNYLLSHIVNVLVISNYLAMEAGLPRNEREELGLAGLLFDIGMLRLNPDLWTKGMKPEEDDVDEIQHHPIYSTDWLEELNYEFTAETLNAIRHHHERMDGSGYPEQIKVEALPTSTRILIIADVYDAMSTSRPHRQAIHPDKILTYLKNRENKFDPEIVEILEQKVGPYPPGTVVQLDTNEIGVSLENGEDPYRPRIKVVIDSAGQVADDPEKVDLTEDTDRKIVETVGSRNTPNALLKYMT